MAVAYGELPAEDGEDLAGAYGRVAVPIVDAQLEKAGLRLAALLNGALK